MLKAALKKWIIVVVGIDTWNYTKNNKLLTLLDLIETSQLDYYT